MRDSFEEILNEIPYVNSFPLFISILNFELQIKKIITLTQINK